MLLADGMHDIHQQLARSGEPLIPILNEQLKLREPRPILEVHDLTLKGLAYEIKYSDYWNSTANDDGKLRATSGTFGNWLTLDKDKSWTPSSCQLRRTPLSYPESTITWVGDKLVSTNKGPRAEPLRRVHPPSQRLELLLGRDPRHQGR